LDDNDPRCVGNTRYVVIFIVGNFTLEEANAFAQDTFDSVTVSNRDFYFQDSPGIHTVAFSTTSVPTDVQYVVGNFSTVDFVDAYTFYLTRYMIQYYFLGCPELAVAGKITTDGGSSTVSECA